jgi:hypothetical protein
MTFKINSVVSLKRTTMVENKLIRPDHLGHVTEITPFKLKVEFEAGRGRYSTYFTREQLNLVCHD